MKMEHEQKINKAIYAGQAATELQYLNIPSLMIQNLEPIGVMYLESGGTKYQYWFDTGCDSAPQNTPEWIIKKRKEIFQTKIREALNEYSKWLLKQVEGNNAENSKPSSNGSRKTPTTRSRKTTASTGRDKRT